MTRKNQAKRTKRLQNGHRNSRMRQDQESRPEGGDVTHSHDATRKTDEDSHVSPLMAELDALRAKISKGREFEDSTSLIREARDERSSRL